MSKVGVILLVGVGVVVLIGGVAYASSSPVPDYRPVMPAGPPPPSPGLQQTIYGAGAAVAKLGVDAWTAATGSRPSAKDIALTVGTGGLYADYKTVKHFFSKIF